MAAICPIDGGVSKKRAAGGDGYGDGRGTPKTQKSPEIRDKHSKGKGQKEKRKAKSQETNLFQIQRDTQRRAKSHAKSQLLRNCASALQGLRRGMIEYF